MQGRVIKINLVGAICILILIIAIIVGAIVYIPKLMSPKETESSKGNEPDEYKTTITVNNEEKELTMKLFKSTYGYTMNYDVESFYVEKDTTGMDRFGSLISDTIFIEVTSQMGRYENVVELLNRTKENASKTISEDEYNVEEIKLNGAEAIYERELNIDGTKYNYFVKKDDNNYLMIKVHCGIDFEKNVEPIIKEMIRTFKLVK